MCVQSLLSWEFLLALRAGRLMDSLLVLCKIEIRESVSFDSATIYNGGTDAAQCLLISKRKSAGLTSGHRKIVVQ